MIQDSRNKISFNATPANTGDNDVFAIFKDSNRSNAMKPIPTNTTTSNTNLLQTMQKNEQNTNIQQNVNHVGQDTFEKKDKKKITKKARVEATVLNSLTPISKADICQILPDVSPTTVEAVLGAMVRNGNIKKISKGRNTRYIKA